MSSLSHELHRRPVMQWIAHRRLRLTGFDQVEGLLDVYLSCSDLHTFLVLAERYDNPAASVTTNYVSYARQICDGLALDRSRVLFFECYRDPASPHAYPYQEHETIALHRIGPLFPSRVSHPRWHPVDRTLRDTLLGSLLKQHALTYSFRTIESWHAACEHQGQWH